MADTTSAVTLAQTPHQLGFRMPAEWHPHASTWMAWPHDDAQWVGMLEPVRRDFARLVTAVAREEAVDLLVADAASAADARRRLGSADVRLHEVPHQDLWLRDSGPIFVVRDGEVALTDWEFNGWGGKYPASLDNEIPAAVARLIGGVTPFRSGLVLEGGSIEVNGAGLALATRQCLLSPTRNPGLDERGIEEALRDLLGITRVIWLDKGLEGDHTDGHIDTITRFAGETTIVTSVTADRDDPNHETLAANLEVLRAARTDQGEPFTIVELPAPEGRMEFEGERLPLTYANFYITNDAVIVPLYGRREDRPALEVIEGVFPALEVIGLQARALITGGGAFHCVTQQQPAGRLWRA
jgi:agmatine deiminase